MTREIRVYTASKIDHAKMWLALHAKWPEVYFTARWPSQVLAGMSEGPIHAQYFWQNDLIDVQNADVVLVYAGEPRENVAIMQIEYDKLRGALVEVGMGLALGKRIIVVGDAPCYGSWQFHPLVEKVSNIENVRNILSLFQKELK